MKIVFQFNNSVNVRLSEQEAKMTPTALVIRYKIMLILLTTIQNIRKMACFWGQSSALSFECMKNTQMEVAIQLEMWLDIRREVCISNNSTTVLQYMYYIDYH